MHAGLGRGGEHRHDARSSLRVPILDLKCGLASLQLEVQVGDALGDTAAPPSHVDPKRHQRRAESSWRGERAFAVAAVWQRFHIRFAAPFRHLLRGPGDDVCRLLRGIFSGRLGDGARHLLLHGPPVRSRRLLPRLDGLPSTRLRCSAGLAVCAAPAPQSEMRRGRANLNLCQLLPPLVRRLSCRAASTPDRGGARRRVHRTWQMFWSKSESRRGAKGTGQQRGSSHSHGAALLVPPWAHGSAVPTPLSERSRRHPRPHCRCGWRTSSLLTKKEGRCASLPLRLRLRAVACVAPARLALLCVVTIHRFA